MVAIAVQPPNSLPQSAIGNQKSAIDRGWIDTFYRTYKGKRLGPYYVRKWRVGRKIKREYIKAKDLESVKAQCEENKRRRLDRIQAGKNENRFIDNFKFLWTMIERQ